MIAKYNDKICKLCGKTFTPKGGVAKYCKSPVNRTCVVCGNTFTSICHPKAPTVCNNPNCKKQVGAVTASKAVHRICRVCGKPFDANSSRQLDCGKEIIKICEICGNPYKSKCGLRWQGHTCDNPKCKAEYAHKGQQAHYLATTRTCAWCGKEFHPTNNKQFLCGEPHISICEICGKEFTVDPGFSKETAPKCCSEECRHKALQIPHPLSKEAIDKMTATKSGRLLGAASLGKSYIGSDLNAETVKEANLIINMLNLTNCGVSNKDILSSQGEYECLFTCPPYYKKEIYSNETEFKSCDDWITECLNRFKCKRYVFVVDTTDKYSQYVVENISTVSHLNTVNEHIIVIDK